MKNFDKEFCRYYIYLQKSLATDKRIKLNDQFKDVDSIEKYNSNSLLIGTSEVFDNVIATKQGVDSFIKAFTKKFKYTLVESDEKDRAGIKLAKFTLVHNSKPEYNIVLRQYGVKFTIHLVYDASKNKGGGESANTI